MSLLVGITIRRRIVLWLRCYVFWLSWRVVLGWISVMWMCLWYIWIWIVNVLVQRASQPSLSALVSAMDLGSSTPVTAVRQKEVPRPRKEPANVPLVTVPLVCQIISSSLLVIMAFHTNQISYFQVPTLFIRLFLQGPHSSYVSLCNCSIIVLLGLAWLQDGDLLSSRSTAHPPTALTTSVNPRLRPKPSSNNGVPLRLEQVCTRTAFHYSSFYWGAHAY